MDGPFPAGGKAVETAHAPALIDGGLRHIDAAGLADPFAATAGRAVRFVETN